MGQLTFPGNPQAAYKLQLELRADPLHPEGPTRFTVRTYGLHGELQREQGYDIVDTEADFIPTMVSATTEGYLFGDTWVAPFNAARRTHAAARRARLTHLARSTPTVDREQGGR